MEGRLETDFQSTLEQQMKAHEIKMPDIHLQTQEKLDAALSQEITSPTINPEEIKQLLAKGASPNQLIDKNHTLLNWLTNRGLYGALDIDLIKEMLDHGAKPNATDVIQLLQSAHPDSPHAFLLVLQKNPALVNNKDVVRFMALAKEMDNQYNHLTANVTRNKKKIQEQLKLHREIVLSDKNKQLLSDNPFLSIKEENADPQALNQKVSVYNYYKRLQK